MAICCSHVEGNPGWCDAHGRQMAECDSIRRIDEIHQMVAEIMAILKGKTTTIHFHMGPDEPLRDQHGNLLGERVTMVMPKPEGITFAMPDELLDKGHAHCSICEDGKSNLPHSAVPKAREEGVAMHYTPGPWETGMEHGAVNGFIVVSRRYGGIASIFNDADRVLPADKVAKGNAHLIAAAPELLSACHAALGYLEGIGGGHEKSAIHDILESVLSKATPKPEGK